MKIEEPETYYSSVISHAYYCIFYSAKAYLAKKGIKTEAPEEHKKTSNEFSKLVFQGIIDKELLTIYDVKVLDKPRTLVRGHFEHPKNSQTPPFKVG